MIIDYDMAKYMGKLARGKSFVGTNEFMAPEIYQSKEYGKEVDWWSIGILLFELLAGETPFFSCKEEMIKKKVINTKFNFTERM